MMKEVYSVEEAIKVTVDKAAGAAEIDGLPGRSARFWRAVAPQFVRAMHQERDALIAGGDKLKGGEQVGVTPMAVNDMLNVIADSIANMATIVATSLVHCHSEPENPTCEVCREKRMQLAEGLLHGAFIKAQVYVGEGITAQNSVMVSK